MSQWFLPKGVTEWSPFRSRGATPSGAVENRTSDNTVAPAGGEAGASSCTVENPALASGVATAAPVDGAAEAARSLLDIDMGGNVEVGEKPEVQADPEVPDDQAAPMDDQELKEEDAAPMDDQEPEKEDDDQGSGDKDKRTGQQPCHCVQKAWTIAAVMLLANRSSRRLLLLTDSPANYWLGTRKLVCKMLGSFYLKL
jgi:hypothetical protein